MPSDAVLVAAIGGLFAAEWILERVWCPPLFNLGVPAFRVEVPARVSATSLVLEQRLVAGVSSTGPLWAFRVHRLEDHLLLFRGGLPYGGWRGAVGRGCIRFLPGGPLVTGYFPWYLLAFCCLATLGMLRVQSGPGDLALVGVLVLGLVILFNYLYREGYVVLARLLSEAQDETSGAAPSAAEQPGAPDKVRR